MIYPATGHLAIARHRAGPGLQKEAVEEIGGPGRIGRHKDETRAELSIALYASRRYLELACDQLLSMLHIGVVDTNYQALGNLGRSGTLSVRSVKSLGHKLPAYSRPVTVTRGIIDGQKVRAYYNSGEVTDVE